MNIKNVWDKIKTKEEFGTFFTIKCAPEKVIYWELFTIDESWMSDKYDIWIACFPNHKYLFYKIKKTLQFFLFYW